MAETKTTFRVKVLTDLGENQSIEIQASNPHQASQIAVKSLRILGVTTHKVLTTKLVKEGSEKSKQLTT